MDRHRRIEEASLAMMREIVARIDADATRSGLELARANLRRWQTQAPSRAVEEWLALLDRPWEELRPILLDQGEEGRRLRQSNPFGGILAPTERWEILRGFRAP